MLAREIGEVEERRHASAVRLRGKDPGTGIGGATHVVAVDKGDLVTVAREFVRAGRSNQAATNDDDVTRSSSGSALAC